MRGLSIDEILLYTFLEHVCKGVVILAGILVGTLGAAGYRDAIDRVRDLAQAAGKKTYTLLMGKPNPAKLANFPEIEVFVHISDPQVSLLNMKAI